MSPIGMVSTSYAARVIAQLSSWPSVRAVGADCGMGVGLATHAGQIIHFHGGEEADLCLTGPVIERIQDVLVETGRVTVIPGHDWVRVRLDTESDAGLLVTLASLAIKANSATDAGGQARRTGPCRAGAGTRAERAS